MPAERMRTAWALSILALVSGCSGDDERDDYGSSNVAGSGGSNQAVAGAAGQGGSAGTGVSGSGGSRPATGGWAGLGGLYVPPETCGNGRVDPREFCDGDFISNRTCLDFGFTTGTLGCTQCQYDLGDCGGVELCTDGIDNDGDGDGDCADPECAELCVDACVAPTPLPDGSQVAGDTSDKGNHYTASCSTPEQSAPEVIYEFVAEQSGVVDVRVHSTLGLSVSARTTCADDASDLFCFPGFLQRPVTAGERLFFVVEGSASGVGGPFVISARSRSVECGNQYRDSGETCDDGNTAAGDGCDSACLVEPSETEPNDTILAAQTGNPFFGSIGSASDVDLVRVAVESGGRRLRARVRDFGDDACVLRLMDPALALLNADGDVLVQTDDLGGGNLCAELVSAPLGPGVYFVKVFAPEEARIGSFSYRLDIALE